ncbi:MAG: RHS repeat-associated core domain-containing protein, partial [Bacteroidota bacterium]
MTEYAGNHIYENGSLQFFNHPEGYVTPDGGGGYDYVYQYKDHLGNVRLSYVDNNGTTEIVEENNYYPFGLKHKGYNTAVSPLGNSVANKWKYNGIELEEALGVDIYEMPLRQYDPAIARWTSIDPVTHHSMSTYTAFDNNPVYWTDPSGTNSTQDLIDEASKHPGTTFTTNGDGTFSGGGYSIGKKTDPPKEGTRRTRIIDHMNGLDGMEGGVTSVKEIYSSISGWQTEAEYFNSFRRIIRAIGQGKASIEILNNYNFTDEMMEIMVGWSIQAYSLYGGKVTHSGRISAMGIDSPIFMLASLRSIGSLFVRSSGTRAIVDMGEETFRQALFSQTEIIGNYSIYGTKGLIEKTFVRNVFLIETDVKSLVAFKSLIRTLETEALEAGANRISIFGSSVIKDAFLNPAVMKRFGYSVQPTNKGVILEKTLR